MTGKHAKPDDAILVIGLSESDGARFALDYFPNTEVCVIWPANPAPMLGHQFQQVYFTAAMQSGVTYVGGAGSLAYAIGGPFTPEQVDLITGSEHYKTDHVWQDRNPKPGAAS